MTRDGRLTLECLRCNTEGHGLRECPTPSSHHPIAHVLMSYFVATCNCGWGGKPRFSHIRARRDARRHERTAP